MGTDNLANNDIYIVYNIFHTHHTAIQECKAKMKQRMTERVPIQHGKTRKAWGGIESCSEYGDVQVWELS